MFTDELADRDCLVTQPGGYLWHEGTAEPSGPCQEVCMAKRHCRPSAQYRYEHYDPRGLPGL